MSRTRIAAVALTATCAWPTVEAPTWAEEAPQELSRPTPKVVVPFIPLPPGIEAMDAESQAADESKSESAPPAPPSPAGAARAGQPAGENPRLALYLHEGFAELRTRNAAAAAAAFQKALQIAPEDSRARFGLATAYIWMHEYEKARDMLEALVREAPTDYAVRNNLAWLYATASDLKVRNGAKALAYGREAVLMAPHDFHVWSTLAEAYYANEKYEEALRAAMEALRLAREAQLPAESLREYEQQVEKCRYAVLALSILE